MTNMDVTPTTSNYRPNVTTVEIHITQKKPLDKKRMQIKVAENGVKLDTIKIDGIRYRVVKAMTRGRYIVSPLEV